MKDTKTNLKSITILNQDSNEKDYPKALYNLLYKIEPKHFWFWGRNQVIGTYVTTMIKNPQKTTFLEIGCGTGFVLSSLENIGFKITGLDMHLQGLHIARKRVKGNLWCGDVRSIGHKEKFDAIGLFDVLEHIEDEVDFLKKVKLFLVGKGKLFLTVPAYNLLWSNVDAVSGHKRRYNLTSLERVLSNSGFKIDKVSYYGSFLFLPLLILRLLKMKKSERNQDLIITILNGGLTPPMRILNVFFKILFLIESKILKVSSLPFGTSIVIAASPK